MKLVEHAVDAVQWALLALGGALLLGGCGGGGGTSMASGGIVGTGTVTLVAYGTNTDSGGATVAIGGQQISTSGATITINKQPAPASALQVGMVLSAAGYLNADGSSTATSISYAAAVQGVVTGIDPAAPAFTVLGQVVHVNKLTLYVGGTFDTLLGQVVEVSGFLAAPGVLQATLVQIKPSVPPPAVPLQLSGTVAALDPVARTFLLGTQLIDYSRVLGALIPSGFSNGMQVRVEGMSASPTAPVVASEIDLLPPALSETDAHRAELEGFISGFTGLGSFQVNGQAVDGRGATVTGGTADMLANGVKVEVEGTLSGGSLMATKIEIEQLSVFEIDGTVQTLDGGAGMVTVGGQAVMTTPATQFIDSSAAAVAPFSLAALRIGDRVAIIAYRGASGLVATRLERLDATAPPPGQPTTSVTGTISNFVSAASFTVGGQPVNAASANFIGGSRSSLANGIRVQVDGVLSGDTLNAAVVTFVPNNPQTPSSVTIQGTISSFASVSNFVVAGQRVDASGAIFSGGTAADLANGRQVTVTGVIQNGILVAQQIAIGQAPQGTSLSVEGSITSFASVSSFVVSGQPVNAANATFQNGTAASLANGVSVSVDGTLQSGVLVAQTVEIQESEGSGPQEIEVKGLITNFVSVSNFQVAGRTIDASSAQFGGGSAADLANGKQVQVKGLLIDQVVKATELEFED